MWNSTSGEKKENVECFSSASSSSVSSSSTGATTHAVEGVFDKITSSPLSSTAVPTVEKIITTDVTTSLGKPTVEEKKSAGEEDCGQNCEFSGDSGFISGPQPTTIDDEIPETLIDVKAPAENKNSKTIENTSCALDSGCIDEFIDEEEQEANELKEPNNFERKSPDNANTNNNTPMLLEKGVDAGISEWFCKINLNDQPQNPNGCCQMNNLGASSSVTVTNKNKKKESPSRERPTNARNSPDPVPKLNYADAWEKFFQQNEDGDTPLHLACISGYVDIIAMLIRMAPHPCLFNIQNDAVQTAMHLAAITRQPKILRMLIIAGAESCIRDHRGNTALHLACMSGDIQCVRALTVPISLSEIQEAHRLYGHWDSNRTMSTLNCPQTMSPADLELRNYDGERCVHIAAYKGHIDVLRHLINYGVDINAKEGKSGRTALHIAVETSNDTLANFLLEECSNLNLETETYAGLTAYQFACILNNSKMQNCLEKYGAEPLTPPDSDYDSSDIESDLDEVSD